MMTNTFEFSLQVVNPKLTVPYWDFTIESSTAGGNAEDIMEPQDSSPLFAADWFGRHDPDDLMVGHSGTRYLVYLNAFSAGNPSSGEFTCEVSIKQWLLKGLRT